MVLNYTMRQCGNFTATKGMPTIQGDKKVNFARTSQQDAVAFLGKKDNKKISKTSKILIIVGTGLVTLAGAYFGIRKLNTKTVSKIEKHFKKLYDNIPENQEKLKKVFMNDKLTEKETLEILRRYEQIEKQGLTQTKEEYFQAVFEEAKKNFGFDDNIKLVFEKLNGRKLGSWNQKGTVCIDPQKAGRGRLFNTIHHELRHAKQTEAALKYAADIEVGEQTLKGALNWLKEEFPDVYKKVAQGRDIDTLVKDFSVDPEIWKLLDEMESPLRNLGGQNNKLFSPCTNVERANVTSEKIQFGRNMKKANEEYVPSEVNWKAYFNNAREVDARRAAGIMEELVGYHPFLDLFI